MILGLTGGYCAGKNAVAALLEERGWDCIDVDRLGHQAVELARNAIVARFGGSVVGPDGQLDRRELARIVFADPLALADQEAIIHPLAIRLLEERLAAAAAGARAEGKEARICVNAALLHRTPQLALCEAILEVRAPWPLRAARGMRRDRLGATAVLRRLWRQRSFRSALRSAARKAGRPIYPLWNTASTQALNSALERALERALGQARA